MKTTTILLLALLLVGCTKPEDNTLDIMEAEEIVKLYELRLHNAKIRAAQEDVKFAAVKESLARIEKGRNALPETTYREAKEKYDWWVLQDKIKDWQECEVELNLAKIRLEMVKRGVKVYRTTKH